MSVTELVVRPYAGVGIRHRRADRYIDATAMCKATGKRLTHYLENQGTKEFLSALAGSAGIPAHLLVQTRMTGPNDERGTWVHPHIAIHLAQWCDPMFAVSVSMWMEELLTTGAVAISPTRVATGQPYLNRVLWSWRVREAVPDGYWCVFAEASDILVTAEQAFVAADLPLDRYDLLDGSIGSHWPKFRESQPWAGERVQYRHVFPPGDGRHPPEAWAYLMAELPHFREWLRHCYLPRHFADYLRRKYGATKFALAVPVIRRLGIPVLATLS